MRTMFGFQTEIQRIHFDSDPLKFEQDHNFCFVLVLLVIVLEALSREFRKGLPWYGIALC